MPTGESLVHCPNGSYKVVSVHLNFPCDDFLCKRRTKNIISWRDKFVHTLSHVCMYVCGYVYVCVCMCACMSWYSTSSSVSIFVLDCKSLSLVFHALGSADVKRVLSKLFFEPQQCLLTLEARLIP